MILRNLNAGVWGKQMDIRPCGQTDGHWTMLEGGHLQAQNGGFGESKPTECFPAEKCTLCDF